MKKGGNIFNKELPGIRLIHMLSHLPFLMNRHWDNNQL